MNHVTRYLLSFLLFFIATCSYKNQSEPTVTVKGRWFSEKQQQKGKEIFSYHCARCHGQYGQGIVENWKKPYSDGTFPPPPLNGTAHTWHHSFEVLINTINTGGKPLGGTMPAFEDSLSFEEKVAVIAYFQSLWDENIYNRWETMNAEQ